MFLQLRAQIEGPKAAAATADVYKHSTYITYIAAPARAAYNLAHTRAASQSASVGTNVYGIPAAEREHSPD